MEVSTFSSPAAVLALVATAVSLLALLALHGLSPEYAPSWRMVSEYANGSHRWALTIVFATWSLASFALLVALWPLSATTLGKIGLVFLFLAGVGQAMGGLFDINHKLHGPAAMIGIQSLCNSAILLTMAMARRTDILAPPLWTAYMPWIGFILMLGAFASLFQALKGAGIDMSAQAGPLKELPQGVSGYVGWANRLLFAASFLWAALAARAALNAGSVEAN